MTLDAAPLSADTSAGGKEERDCDRLAAAVPVSGVLLALLYYRDPECESSRQGVEGGFRRLRVPEAEPEGRHPAQSCPPEGSALSASSRA
jgi:hypothetical protein